MNLCELQISVNLPRHFHVFNEEVQNVGLPENEPWHTFSELDELYYGLNLLGGRLNVDKAGVKKVEASFLSEDQALS